MQKSQREGDSMNRYNQITILLAIGCIMGTLLFIIAQVEGVEAIVGGQHIWAQDMKLLENGTLELTVSELTAEMVGPQPGVIFKAFQW